MAHLCSAQTAAIGLPLQLVRVQPQTPLNPSSKYCAQSHFFIICQISVPAVLQLEIFVKWVTLQRLQVVIQVSLFHVKSLFIPVPSLLSLFYDESLFPRPLTTTFPFGQYLVSPPLGWNHVFQHNCFTFALAQSLPALPLLRLASFGGLLRLSWSFGYSHAALLLQLSAQTSVV